MTFNYIYNYPQLARDAGFKLHNFKDGPLDWRLIGSVEIERILRDQSFEQIDAVLNHLSEAPLGSILDSNILDSGIAKYFMLSQFSVQYLIFCRKFLEETVTDVRESLNISQMELANVRRSLSEAKNEILQLNKKLTEMEAIHEVLYPCHLCTKNFISNDSLNLHISRKHSGSSANPEKKIEIPQPLCKERENDLTLINTIKLELEIKHLKERLNIAEREIKEKNFESVIKNSSEKSEVKHVSSIGIQSNLSEIKEKDDSNECSLSVSSQSRQEMTKLLEKFQGFEKWKEEQILQNSELLDEINTKIQDLSAALETTRNQRDIQMNNNKQKASSPAEDIEAMLKTKVEEISKATAANLEDLISKMEINYKAKLHLLEKELHELNEQYIIQKDFKNSQDHIKLGDRKAQNVNFKAANVNGGNSNGNNPEELSVTQTDNEPQVKEASATESNHTFVKCSNITQLENNSYNDGHSSSDEDSTEISDSLVDEEFEEKAYSEPKIFNENSAHVLKDKKPRLKQKLAAPKIMTKIDAKKLTSNRLSSMGVDTKAKTLTPLLKKRYLDELGERRNKLKQKNSQFYATRNKIKKFVEKLCTRKLPRNAEALLKATRHSRPKSEKRFSDDEPSLTEKEEPEFLKASTPLKKKPSTESENFKKRLERILTSPIRKPDDQFEEDTADNADEFEKPTPMPRKRVMFNQPEVQESSFNSSLNLTDSKESRIFERYPKQSFKCSLLVE